MTNIEKWLIQKGFELRKKEVSYNPVLTETKLVYKACFYGNNHFEATVRLFSELRGSNMNCCEIKADSALFINRLQTSIEDKKDIYASRFPNFCKEKAEEAVFLLNLWAREMDAVDNPFDEAKEELG